MKLLYCTRELPYGMAEAHILPEIISHLAHGWDIRIAQLKRSKMVHQKGSALLPITFDEPILSVTVVLYALAEAINRPIPVVRLLREVLLNSGSGKNIVQNLVSFPKSLWLATIIRRERFDRVHVHWASVPATFAGFAAHLANVPYSVTSHRYDIAAQNLLQWKIANAQFVRAIDEPGANEFAAAAGPGAARPVVLHVGVEFPESPSPIRSGALSTLKVATGARLVEKKGIIYMLRGVAQAKSEGVNVQVDLFGDGPLEKNLKAAAQNLGIEEQVRFLGVVSHETLLFSLSSGVYDLAALPSVTSTDGDKEGIPVFLMEAMAAGVPVLTTPNGGILELCGNGKGVVVPERDSKAIGRALVELARKEDLRRRLAAEGRAHVREHFEVERNISRLRQLIEAA